MSIFYTKTGELIKAHVDHTLKSFYYTTDVSVYYVSLEDGEIVRYPELHWSTFEPSKTIVQVLDKEIQRVKSHIESESATFTYTIDQKFIFLMAPVKASGQVRGFLVAGPISHCRCFEPCVGSNLDEETLDILMRNKVVRTHPRQVYIAQLLHHLNRKSIYVGPNEVINREDFYFTREDMLRRTMSPHIHERLELIARLVCQVRKQEALTLYKKSILFQDFDNPSIEGDFEMLKQNLITLETLISSALLKESLEAHKLLQIKHQFFLQLIKTQDYNCLVGIGDNIIKVYSETVRRKALEGLSQPVRKAVLHIQEHFRHPLDLEGICDQVNRSRSYLSSRFKQEVGLSITDYIKTTRIEYSQHLLNYTELSILDIAHESGFENQSYFSTVFKAVTGMTPMAFRSH